MRYVVGLVMVVSLAVSASEHADAPQTAVKKRMEIAGTAVDAQGVRRIVVGPLRGTVVKTEFTGREGGYTNSYGTHDFISPSGRFVFGERHLEAERRSVRALIDTATGATVQTLPEVEGPDAYFSEAHYSPDGRYLAVTLHNGMVFLIHLADGKLTGPIQAGSKAKFSPDGRFLLAHNEEKWLSKDSDKERISIIDVQTGKILGTHPTDGF